MNVWITESSMMHSEEMKSSLIGPLISKKDFEDSKENSALTLAENFTACYDGNGFQVISVH